MTTVIVDRRLADRGKSLSNQNRYLDKVKAELAASSKKSIIETDIRDLVKSKTRKVTISGKGLRQPSFVHGKGGNRTHIITGNDRYQRGDKIKKPPQDQQGNGCGCGGDGEDGQRDLEVELTREQFIDIYLADMGLPDFIKKAITIDPDNAPQRAGLSNKGTPGRLNLFRTVKNAKGRNLALKISIKNRIDNLEKRLLTLTDPEQIRLAKIQLTNLERQYKSIPYFDEMDLRYNNYKIQPTPISQGVFFPILDISSSMGDWEIEMAQRYFMFQLLMIEINYEHIVIEPIVHTTEARIVPIEDFMKIRENGGTIVSSALRLVDKTIKEKYDLSKWNVFISQASDGDNFAHDNPLVENILVNDLLPITQYFTYVQVNQSNRIDNSLLDIYQRLKSGYKNLESGIVHDVKDIWPLFRKHYGKKS